MLDVATKYKLGPVPLLLTGVIVIIALATAQVFIALERGPQHILLVILVIGTLAPIPLMGGVWPAIGGLAGAAILLTVRFRWSPWFVAATFSVDALLYWEFSQANSAILGHRVLMNVNIRSEENTSELQSRAHLV